MIRIATRIDNSPKQLSNDLNQPVRRTYLKQLMLLLPTTKNTY